MTYQCPICGQPTDSAVDKEFPFCSPRCRLIDLGEWAAEEYRVSEPAAAFPPPDDESYSS